MSHPNLEHTLRSLRQVSLTDEARTRIRSTLVAYADLHAAQDGGTVMPFTSFFIPFFTNRTASTTVALVLVAVLGSGSISLGAERATPGDTLYPIKIHLNEAVSASFATTIESRARYHAALADRRALEAVMLADEGKLDEETALYLEQEVTIQLASTDENTRALEAKGDIATALAVRTDIASDMTKRAKELHAILDEGEAPQAEQVPENSAFMTASIDMQKAAPEAHASIADRFEQRADELVEAQHRTETALLPGITHEIDFDTLRNAVIETPAALPLDSETDEDEGESAGLASTTERTRAADTFEIHDVRRALWFKTGQ